MQILSTLFNQNRYPSFSRPYFTSIISLQMLIVETLLEIKIQVSVVHIKYKKQDKKLDGQIGDEKKQLS